MGRGESMKTCKYCNSKPREFRDQADKYETTFHVIECPKGCYRVVSYISITNCRKLWDKANIYTKTDFYNELMYILEQEFRGIETLEQIRLKCKEWEQRNEI